MSGRRWWSRRIDALSSVTDLCPSPTIDRERNVLHGVGACEGLTAVLGWLPEESMQEGVIFPGELPPQPDPVEPPAE